MKPSKGSNYLRKGRTSIKNQHYLLTTTVFDRKPAFNRENAAAVVLNSLRWLENQEKIILDAAVVMPDHLHYFYSSKFSLKIKANQFIQN
jgi:REP element-mobilizing transposase RayT